MKPDSQGVMFYDPIKTFEVNPNMSIKFDTVEGVKLIIIDDFYKNPEMVRDLIVSTPVTSNNPAYVSGYSGYRIWSDLAIQNLDIFPILTNIFKEGFNLTDEFLKEDEVIMTKNRCIIGNIFTGTPNVTNNNRRHQPHWDFCLYSALIYFDKKPGNGTALFRHKETNTTYVPTTLSQVKLGARDLGISVEEFDKTSKDNFDKLHAIHLNDDVNNEKLVDSDTMEYINIYNTEGKYNQLVAFAGATLHSPIANYEQLKNDDEIRVNQVMFLNPVKRRF